MNDIEILEKLIRQENFIDYEEYQVEIDTAIENLLKERQADKDRIDILRNRVQENEQTIKDLSNIAGKVKREYEDRIRALMSREYIKLNYTDKQKIKRKIKWLDKEGYWIFTTIDDVDNAKKILQELLKESD